MNPTKALNEKIVKLRGAVEKLSSELSDEQVAHSNLKDKYSELIESSCDTDNRLSDLSSDVSKFCDNCTEKFGATCSECVLNKYLS